MGGSVILAVVELLTRKENTLLMIIESVLYERFMSNCWSVGPLVGWLVCLS